MKCTVCGGCLQEYKTNHPDSNTPHFGFRFEEMYAEAKEALTQTPGPTTFAEYSYAWTFCTTCEKFTALSKKHGEPFVCPCGWSREAV